MVINVHYTAIPKRIFLNNQEPCKFLNFVARHIQQHKIIT